MECETDNLMVARMVPLMVAKSDISTVELLAALKDRK
jgi:hypothetical protein